MSGFFKAVLVVGARQVGKTTMLKHLSEGRTYVSLDDINTLIVGNAAGHYFENFAITELIKDLDYHSVSYDVSYFRDCNSKEIDLFLKYDDAIHPLEIKLSSNPDRRDVKKYSVLDANSIPRGEGGIVCMSPSVLPIDKENCYIPINIL